MKKLSVLFCLLLLFSCALAEPVTRTNVIILEGMEEEYTETLFESDKGYCFWYDADRFMLYPENTDDNSDMFVPTGATDDMLSLRISKIGDRLMYPLSDAARDLNAALKEKGYHVYTDESIALQSQYDYVHVFGQNEMGEDMEYFVFSTPRGMYCAALRYPEDAFEGFAQRMHRAIESLFIQPTNAEAGIARVGLGGYAQLPPLARMTYIPIDETGERVYFYVTESVTNAVIARVTLVEDGARAYYADTKTYLSLDTLERNMVIAATVEFPDVIPALTFSYTKKDGQTEKWLVTQSGQDGSILLLPFDESSL